MIITNFCTFDYVSILKITNTNGTKTIKQTDSKMRDK